PCARPCARPYANGPRRPRQSGSRGPDPPSNFLLLRTSGTCPPDGVRTRNLPCELQKLNRPCHSPLVERLREHLRESSRALQAVFHNRALRPLPLAWAGSIIRPWAYAVPRVALAY